MVNEQKTRINRSIRAPEVRLIGSSGENFGVVSIQAALEAAAEAGLDLVEISPTASPPVCQIMDYSKYQYDQQKKERLRKKKQKQIKTKEIKLRPGTDENDYLVKVKKIKEFLEEGNKVKITLRFRGREMSHQELGTDVLNRLENDLKDNGIVEQMPKKDNRQMVMVFGPKRTVTG